MNPRYPLVSGRADHRCEYCRAPEAIFNFPFEIEHITPISRGGTDEESNLALACRSCNIHKSNHLTGTDESTGNETLLFNPRQDKWDEHFQIDRESGAINGVTPEGRATVSRLRMNAFLQSEARLLWIGLGLFQ